RDDEHAGGAEILIAIGAIEVAEGAPEVENRQLRLAVVDVRGARRVAQLDEALSEVAGHAARVHAVASREIDVAAVDRRTRPRHPHTAGAAAGRDVPHRRRWREAGIPIQPAHVVRDDEAVVRALAHLAVDLYV